MNARSTSLALVASLPPWDSLPVRSLDRVVGLWPDPKQDLDGDSLLIVTVQSREAYETSLWMGQRLEQSWARVDPDMAPAYRWMAHRMTERGISTDQNAPLWAWVRLPASRLAEELAQVEPGDSVVLVAEVPAVRCLLSVHDQWHHVMNRSWCPAPGGKQDAYDTFEAEVSERLGTPLWWFEHLPTDLRRKVETSWKWSEVLSLYPADSAIQVALPWLHSHEVVAAARIQ